MNTYILFNKNTGFIENKISCLEEPEYLDHQGFLQVENIKINFRTHYVDIISNTLKEYTQEEKEIINNLKHGYIWKLPERIVQDVRILQQTKDQKWQSVKQERSLRENSTFTYNGNLYDADKEHIPGAAQLALLAKSANQPFSINWTLADNSVVTLDADEMIAVGAALGSYINSIYDTARDLRDQINAATTIAEVDSIQWPT